MKDKIMGWFANLFKKARGISLIISSHEVRLGADYMHLWYDGHYLPREDRLGNQGWGVLIALRWGFWTQPVPKLYLWKKVDNFPYIAPAWQNEWKTDGYWFVLSGPFIIFPYISIAYKSLGMYAGLKDYPLNNPLYLNWLNPKYKGDNEAMGLSASTRKTRIV